MAQHGQTEQRQLKAEKRAAALRENLRRRKIAENDRKDSKNKGETEEHEHGK